MPAPRSATPRHLRTSSSFSVPAGYTDPFQPSEGDDRGEEFAPPLGSRSMPAPRQRRRGGQLATVQDSAWAQFNSDGAQRRRRLTVRLLLGAAIAVSAALAWGLFLVNQTPAG
ncbi:hypothetical protein [Zhihengliuella flava]|uniref:Uncharacterized protein n=1 Tax=Zhihengliuella flava TaxID=1285193 RepID=A0A931D359_9MICC|nr:hypothetical protein [Zhihengliuella flava]MBG6083534.1 hypothetical protein [Zhihengliuella flava]